MKKLVTTLHLVIVSFKLFAGEEHEKGVYEEEEMWGWGI